MRGVTLIELLVVIGLLSVLTGFGLQDRVHGFVRSLGQTDQSRTGSILRHARARSMAGVPQKVTWMEDEHAFEVKSRDGNGNTSVEVFELSGTTRASTFDDPLFNGTTATESTLRFSVPQTSAWEVHIGPLGSIDTLSL